MTIPRTRGRTERPGWSRPAPALVLALACLSGPAAAEAPAPPAPPVDRLVLEALQHAPGIAARRAAMDAARHREEPAGALPDPVVELMVQDVGFPDWTVGEAEMSMIGPQVTQGIPFPGKQGARKAAAAAETVVRREELESVRREIVLEVRRLYAELYALDREIEIVEASRDLVELLSATVAHHVEMAETDQEAAVKARLLVSRTEETRTDLEAERDATVARLNRYLDRPGDAPLGPVMSLPEPEPPPAALDSLAELSSAEVAVDTAEEGAAAARVLATRRELRPDFMAGAGVGFRGDFDPVVSFRLGVEIPLWQGRKQRPMIRAAEAELDAARHTLRDARALARADAAGLRAAWRRADEQVLRYRQSLVPQSGLALDAARSAYLGRRGDFSSVLEDFDLWLETRRGLARREAERYVVWARIEALLHPAPDVVPAPEGETE